ncbi:MAG: NAD synthetase [Bacteroidetes bacterium QH_8_67_23]|nr:MAG: NAD synthetase [Bacteroidetes bacterium QH_8_67_23]
MLLQLAYLASAALFIVGLKRMQSPVTARRGNALASGGMLVAVLATLFLHDLLSPWMVVLGLLLGGGIGAVLARQVEMTAMPELVAVFNGFGGLASALVALAEVAQYAGDSAILSGSEQAAGIGAGTAVTIALSVLIGMVTCSGSFVAYGKLSGRLGGNPVQFMGMRTATIGVLGGALVFAVVFILGAGATDWLMIPSIALLALAALALGILLVVPIGGADMPVVVALLNSYSGLAAAATGFVIDNIALIVSGTLVGAAGFILTVIMCEAMNRSLQNVLLGGFGGEEAGATGAAAEAPEDRTVNETSPDDTAILTSYAEQVIIVPGYGLAVAQAQHQVRELADLLEERGVTVKYAIHPVAGRMPGHMNVLLAEANVPYDQLFEMEEINAEFAQTDVALVVGANDVVNPAARTDEGSPIYGMPILDVDEAETVVVMKRSLSPGYSGVPNELFYQSNTRMLFGDAKDSADAIVSEVKALS